MSKSAGKIIVIMMALFMAGMLSMPADAMMGDGGGGMGDGWRDWMEGHWGPPAGGYMWGGNDPW